MLPSAKPFQVERSAIKYVQSTLQLVVDSLVQHGIQEDQLALSLHDLDQASGRVKIDGKLQYIAPLLHRIPATRLLTVDFRGNEGKLSRVSLNPLYERAFISLLARVAESTVPGLSAASNTDVNHEVAVNLDAARSFMRKTRASLAAQANLQSEYARSLLRNLLIAQKLLERVADAATSPCLKESWSQSDSGRMYEQREAAGHEVVLVAPPDERFTNWRRYPLQAQPLPHERALRCCKLCSISDLDDFGAVEQAFDMSKRLFSPASYQRRLVLDVIQASKERLLAARVLL